jgi:hypothetical protein
LKVKDPSEVSQIDANIIVIGHSIRQHFKCYLHQLSIKLDKKSIHELNISTFSNLVDDSYGNQVIDFEDQFFDDFNYFEEYFLFPCFDFIKTNSLFGCCFQPLQCVQMILPMSFPPELYLYYGGQESDPMLSITGHEKTILRVTRLYHRVFNQSEESFHHSLFDMDTIVQDIHASHPSYHSDDWQPDQRSSTESLMSTFVMKYLSASRIITYTHPVSLLTSRLAMLYVKINLHEAMIGMDDHVDDSKTFLILVYCFDKNELTNCSTFLNQSGCNDSMRSSERHEITMETSPLCSHRMDGMLSLAFIDIWKLILTRLCLLFFLFYPSWHPDDQALNDGVEYVNSTANAERPMNSKFPLQKISAIFNQNVESDHALMFKYQCTLIDRVTMISTPYAIPQPPPLKKESSSESRPGPRKIIKKIKSEK